MKNEDRATCIPCSVPPAEIKTFDENIGEHGSWKCTYDVTKPKSVICNLLCCQEQEWNKLFPIKIDKAMSQISCRI